ncbi:MAG: hypothetical protein J6Y90_01245, partial [Lachnospiraceae bacterium]|nr:hypothetical protein [Lachnospiraceae bacterium]
MRKGAARIIAFLMIICIIITGEASTPLLAIADMLNDSPATLSKAVLTSDWDIYRIKVTYGKDAGIPDDAVLVVTELTVKNSPQYEDYIRTGT